MNAPNPVRWLTRWTVWLWAAPRRYVDPHPEWEEVDLREWSAETYGWKRDELGGSADYVRNPWKTYVTGEGDCEDYALVALNVLYVGTDRPLSLGFCADGAMVKHVVAHDGEHVYSSDGIHEDLDVEGYVEQSKYDWYVERAVRT